MRGEFMSWPVVRDENSVSEDGLDPLTDGHGRAAVQAERKFIKFDAFVDF